MPALTEEKEAQMTKNFKKLDQNGDGTLDFNELKDMLKKGNPTFKDRECRDLYDQCDQNGDGKISFEEFLHYIYRNDKKVGARKQRLAANAAVGDDGTELDWEPCKRTFVNFAGQDMDSREFTKFCKDNKLFNKKFINTDADLIFSRVVPKGQRRMNFGHFQDACRHIARKREQTNAEIQKIVNASSGPIIKGTETDYVKFYDDKTTYTGHHTFNEHFQAAGADPNAAHGRHEKLEAEKQARRSMQASEEKDWTECERVFNAFAGEGLELDGKEFKKMCEEIPGLVEGGFKTNLIDIVFANVKGSDPRIRTIQFDQFKDAIKEIASLKGEKVNIVQGCVERSKGPLSSGTKAEYNKFHDDKDLYTGTHIGK